MERTRKLPPSFFKVMIGDFAEKMRIPPAFIKSFHGELAPEITLKCQNGKVWTVKLRKDAGNLYFDNGWQDFVKDSSLELGDFLVFKYDGHSNFLVQMYGKNGCEKEESLPPDKERKCFKYPAFCKCRYVVKTVPSAKRKSGVRRKMVFNAESCPLKLKSPHFTAKWKSKPYTVLIPKVFVREHKLTKERERFFRDPNGKQWPVNIVQSINRTDFGSGWNDFRVGNNLGEDDKCIFEFVEDGIIQVHIIRDGE